MTVCTAETARCADAPSYQYALRECCRGHLIQMMRDLHEAFTAAEIRYWLDYGTLLGAVRNPLTTWRDYPWLGVDSDEPLKPGIIPHDKDVDICALADDYWRARRICERLCEEKGYIVQRRAGWSMLKVLLSGTNNTAVDIFFWRCQGTTLRRMRYLSVDRFKGRDLEWDQVFPLTTVEWEGLQLPAPRDPEWLCEYRYGPNWMTPVAANNSGVLR